MTATATTPEVTRQESSWKLVMEPCPQCQVTTAFQFSTDANHYYCLKCGYIKNIRSGPDRQ